MATTHETENAQTSIKKPTIKSLTLKVNSLNEELKKKNIILEDIRSALFTTNHTDDEEAEPILDLDYYSSELLLAAGLSDDDDSVLASGFEDFLEKYNEHIEEIIKLKVELENKRKSQPRGVPARKCISYKKPCNKEQFPLRFGVLESEYYRKATGHTDKAYTIPADIIQSWCPPRQAHIDNKRKFGGKGEDLWFNSRQNCLRCLKRLFKNDEFLKKKAKPNTGKVAEKIGEWTWVDCSACKNTEEAESESEDEAESDGEFEDSDSE